MFYPYATLFDLDDKSLDHWPLLLSTYVDNPKPKVRFYLDAQWKEDKKVEEVVIHN